MGKVFRPESEALRHSEDDAELENMSISGLVSILRIAFRTEVFNKVEEVLVSREMKLKKECELVQSKYEITRLDKLNLEADVHKYKKDSEQLNKTERENKELKELNFRVNADMMDAQEREKNAVERYEKLLEEVKRGAFDVEDKRLISELRTKNRELESAKRGVENELELCKNRFEDLKSRVLRLERDTTALLNGETIVTKKIDVESSSRLANLGKVIGEKLVCEKGITGERTDCGDTTGNENELMNMSGKLTSPGSVKFAPSAVVEIIDSDDDCDLAETFCFKGSNSEPEVLKRKRDSIPNASEINNGNEDDEENYSVLSKRTRPLSETPIEHTILEQCERKERVEQSSRSFLRGHFTDGGPSDLSSEDSGSSSDSDDDTDFFFVSQLIKGRKDKSGKRWESEADMLVALEKDDELCMKAVCALYRQEILKSTSSNSSWLSQLKGFNISDLLRGRTLAEFLTDGNHQGKLKKSTTELERFDNKCLSDCRRLAIEHAKQLFEIYQSKTEPLLLS